MTVLDANILIYAYNADAPQHLAATEWLSKLLASNEVVGLPSVTLWAFTRICTNSRIWNTPRSAKESFEIVHHWLKQPAVVLLHPGPRHWEILEELVTKHEATGPLVTDAILAAIAIENEAQLASTDHDFSRFPGLRWINPLLAT